MTFSLRSFGFITLPGLLVSALLVGPTVQAGSITYDFIDADGGFTAGGETGAGQPWFWNSTLGQWEVPQSLGGTSGTSTLATPSVTADGSLLTLAFTHERDFDGNPAGTGIEDRGTLQVSINGGSNQLVGVDIGTFVQGGYTLFLDFIPTNAWGFTNSGVTSIAEISGLSTGDSLAFQWIGSWDCCGVDGDPAWAISSVTIDGIQSDVTSVPVPGSALLLGLGLGAFGLRQRHRIRA